MIDKIRKEYLFGIILLFIAIATLKYVSYGQPYSFETGNSLEDFEIVSGTVVSQDFIIEENTKWDNKSFGIKLAKLYEGSGNIKVVISQNQLSVYERTFDVREINTEDYIYPDSYDYASIEYGIGTVSLTTESKNTGIAVSLTDNSYNLPNCFVNGVDHGKTMVQKYYYHYEDMEFFLRLMAYGIFVVLLLVAYFLLLSGEGERESVKLCYITYGIAIVIMICLAFIYEGTMFSERIAWAETVTNFYHQGVNASLKDCLLYPDAGYFPLFIRLISIVIIKVFRIESYYAVITMQWISIISSGAIVSLFIMFPFRRILSLKYRFCLSIILMAITFHFETLMFINFMVYAIIPIFFFFISATEEWRKSEFICIALLSMFASMSKGQYIIFFPYTLLMYGLFRKSYTKRERIFLGMVGFGGFVQFIYYFFMPKQVDKVWFNYNGQAIGLEYFLKLFLDVVRDIPSSLFWIFEDNILIFNSVSKLFTAVFWGIALYFLYKKIFIKLIRKEAINRNDRMFFMLLVFEITVIAFFRLTVLGVTGYSVMSDDFWNYRCLFSVGNRHGIFVFIPICIGVIILMDKDKIGGIEWKKHKKIIFIVAISLSMIATPRMQLNGLGTDSYVANSLSMIATPRMQLNGLGTDSYVANRSYSSDMFGEKILLKGLDDTNCRFVPIQPDGWAYCKNANIYFVGEDECFGWKDFAIQLSNFSVNEGYINLDELEVDNSCGIYQIFIRKLNLINANAYYVSIYDSNGNCIIKKAQDNSKRQYITSFTFDLPVYEASVIQIEDYKGDCVNICNAMYFVTSDAESMLRSEKNVK